ncbi:MAG: GSU2403 family nucleotidyltransferase fold protein [Hyphomonadaceae bacterium]
MRSIPATLQTTYANLVQMHLNRPSFDFNGAPFTMVRKGKTYWYANQRPINGASPRQRYLGPDSEEMRLRIEEMRAHQQSRAEFRKHASGLVAQLRAGGIAGPDRDTGPMLRALANSGVFRLGGTLVGTHAFRHYDLQLGVHLAEGTDWITQTDDIDIASFEHLSMAIEDTADPDLVAALGQLGFKPANSLNPKTPTTWMLANSKYAIDFLTPSFEEKQAPKKLAALNMWAQGLHYLNFLIADPIPAVSPYMEGLLVQIPKPERYAVHKLIVSQKRHATSSTKKQKDIEQARVLIEALSETRPYELNEALALAGDKGPAWNDALNRALDITFKAPSLNHDFDRDIVWFEGTALGKTHRCAISQEALADHFELKTGSSADMLNTVRTYRGAIEALMKRKFRAEPAASTLLTSHDVAALREKDNR